jgi:hypothetical protein
VLLCGGRRDRLSAAAGNPTKLDHEVVRRLPALLRIFREAPPHETLERGGRRWLHGRHGIRIGRHDGRYQHRARLPVERLAPRDHLVEHGAK